MREERHVREERLASNACPKVEAERDTSAPAPAPRATAPHNGPTQAACVRAGGATCMPGVASGPRLRTKERGRVALRAAPVLRPSAPL